MTPTQEKISINIIIEICDETMRSISNTNIINNEIIKTVLFADKNNHSECIETALKNLELLQKNTAISIQNKLELIKQLK
jgi:type I site-specific restriction endonuclease